LRLPLGTLLLAEMHGWPAAAFCLAEALALSLGSGSVRLAGRHVLALETRIMGRLPAAAMHLLTPTASCPSVCCLPLQRPRSWACVSRGNSPTRKQSREPRIRSQMGSWTCRRPSCTCAFRAGACVFQDEDGSGFISLEEFQRGLEESGIEMDPQAVAAIMEKLDATDNGKLCYEEFVAAAFDTQQALTGQTLTNIFGEQLVCTWYARGSSRGCLAGLSREF
jgi:EF-hand domain pair